MRRRPLLATVATLLAAALAGPLGPAVAAAAPRGADRRAGAAAPLQGPARGVVRAPAGAVRSCRPQGRHDPDRLRVVPGRLRPRRRHGRRHGGRPRLPQHRQPRLLPGAVRPAAALPQPAAGRQPWHRHLGAGELQAPAAVAGRRRQPGVPAAGRGLRPPAQPHAGASRWRLRPRQRPVRHRQHRPRPGRRARGPADRPGRPVRRLLRELLRAGLRRAPPGAAAVGDPRRHLAGAGDRPVLPLDPADHADRLRPGLPAQPGVRGRGPRTVDGADRRPGRAAPARSGGRPDPRAGRPAGHLDGGRRGAGHHGQQRRLRLRRLPRPGRRRQGRARTGRRRPAAAPGRPVDLHRRLRPGGGLLGGPLHRRLLQRLPAGLRHGRRASDPAGTVRRRGRRPCPTTPSRRSPSTSG